MRFKELYQLVCESILVQQATIIPPSKKRGKYIFPDARSK
jgi:hypothetical protein